MEKLTTYHENKDGDKVDLNFKMDKNLNQMNALIE